MDDDDEKFRQKNKALIGAVIGISLAILVIFIIALVLFFFYFNQTQYHEVIVKNGTTEKFTIMFGAIDSRGNEKFLPNRTLSPNENFIYKCTSGTSNIIEGFKPGDQVGSNNPFTRVLISFAGNEYHLPPSITDGHSILTNLQNKKLSDDTYTISLQKGLNYGAQVAPNYTDWKERCDVVIANNISEKSCPQELRGPGPFNSQGTGTYQYCMSACFNDPTSDVLCCTQKGICPGPCQQQWPNMDYYSVFHNACANCSITGCDIYGKTCTRKSGLSSYQIDFF